MQEDICLSERPELLPPDAEIFRRVQVPLIAICASTAVNGRALSQTVLYYLLVQESIAILKSELKYCRANLNQIVGLLRHGHRMYLVCILWKAAEQVHVALVYLEGQIND